MPFTTIFAQKFIVTFAIYAELTGDVPGLIQTIQVPGFSTSIKPGQDGDRLPGSPETQFSVYGDYRHPLSNGSDITLNAGYAWQDEVLSFAGGRGGGALPYQAMAEQMLLLAIALRFGP